MSYFRIASKLRFQSELSSAILHVVKLPGASEGKWPMPVTDDVTLAARGEARAGCR
jgi:hypothetical protein